MGRARAGCATINFSIFAPEVSSSSGLQGTKRINLVIIGELPHGSCLPGEGEGLVYSLLVDEPDLYGAVGVEREPGAGEHQLDLELGRCRDVS